MEQDRKLFQQALDTIIDGVAMSDANESRAEAGKVILTSLMPRFGHLVDESKLPAILSILKMADEAQSPSFKL